MRADNIVSLTVVSLCLWSASVFTLKDVSQIWEEQFLERLRDNNTYVEKNRMDTSASASRQVNRYLSPYSDSQPFKPPNYSNEPKFIGVSRPPQWNTSTERRGDTGRVQIIKWIKPAFYASLAGFQSFTGSTQENEPLNLAESSHSTPTTVTNNSTDSKESFKIKVPDPSGDNLSDYVLKSLKKNSIVKENSTLNVLDLFINGTNHSVTTDASSDVNQSSTKSDLGYLRRRRNRKKPKFDIDSLLEPSKVESRKSGGDSEKEMFGTPGTPKLITYVGDAYGLRKKPLSSSTNANNKPSVQIHYDNHEQYGRSTPTSISDIQFSDAQNSDKPHTIEGSFSDHNVGEPEHHQPPPPPPPPPRPDEPQPPDEYDDGRNYRGPGIVYQPAKEPHDMRGPPHSHASYRGPNQDPQFNPELSEIKRPRKPIQEKPVNSYEGEGYSHESDDDHHGPPPPHFNDGPPDEGPPNDGPPNDGPPNDGPPGPRPHLEHSAYQSHGEGPPDQHPVPPYNFRPNYESGHQPLPSPGYPTPYDYLHGPVMVHGQSYQGMNTNNKLLPFSTEDAMRELNKALDAVRHAVYKLKPLKSLASKLYGDYKIRLKNRIRAMKAVHPYLYLKPDMASHQHFYFNQQPYSWDDAQAFMKATANSVPDSGYLKVQTKSWPEETVGQNQFPVLSYQPQRLQRRSSDDSINDYSEANDDMAKKTFGYRVTVYEIGGKPNVTEEFFTNDDDANNTKSNDKFKKSDKILKDSNYPDDYYVGAQSNLSPEMVKTKKDSSYNQDRSTHIDVHNAHKEKEATGHEHKQMERSKDTASVTRKGNNEKVFKERTQIEFFEREQIYDDKKREPSSSYIGSQRRNDLKNVKTGKNGKSGKSGKKVKGVREKGYKIITELELLDKDQHFEDGFKYQSSGKGEHTKDHTLKSTAYGNKLVDNTDENESHRNRNQHYNHNHNHVNDQHHDQLNNVNDQHVSQAFRNAENMYSPQVDVDNDNGSSEMRGESAPAEEISGHYQVTQAPEPTIQTTIVYELQPDDTSMNEQLSVTTVPHLNSLPMQVPVPNSAYNNNAYNNNNNNQNNDYNANNGNTMDMNTVPFSMNTYSDEYVNSNNETPQTERYNRVERPAIEDADHNAYPYRKEVDSAKYILMNPIIRHRLNPSESIPQHHQQQQQFNDANYLMTSNEAVNRFPVQPNHAATATAAMRLKAPNSLRMMPIHLPSPNSHRFIIAHHHQTLPYHRHVPRLFGRLLRRHANDSPTANTMNNVNVPVESIAYINRNNSILNALIAKNQFKQRNFIKITDNHRNHNNHISRFSPMLQTSLSATKAMKNVWLAYRAPGKQHNNM